MAACAPSSAASRAPFAVAGLRHASGLSEIRIVRTNALEPAEMAGSSSLVGAGGSAACGRSGCEDRSGETVKAGAPLGEGVKREEVRCERLEGFQRDHGRPVGRRAVRVGMGFIF